MALIQSLLMLHAGQLWVAGLCTGLQTEANTAANIRQITCTCSLPYIYIFLKTFSDLRRRL